MGGMSGLPSTTATTGPSATAWIGAPKPGQSVFSIPSPEKNLPPTSWIQSIANISGATKLPPDARTVRRWGNEGSSQHPLAFVHPGPRRGDEITTGGRGSTVRTGELADVLPMTAREG